MSEARMDKTRRNLIVAGSAAAGAAGLGAAVPFVWSMWPSERARAAGAPVEADFSRLAPGEMQIVEWRSKPVWIIRRTPDMLGGLAKVESKLTDAKSDIAQQPEYAKNAYRSIKPEVMVVVGICTHLGCSPTAKSAEAKAEMGADWQGGFYCACHGSKFDLAGRVYSGSPAPTNLVVPPHMYLSDGSILIGEDKKEG